MIIIMIAILLKSQSQKITSPPFPVISRSPLPTTFPSPLISFPQQKTIIGKTTTSDIDRIYPDMNKQTLANGDLEYTVDSRIMARPNQIIFRNNLAQFERIVITGDPNSSGFLRLSEQVNKYGPAEQVIKGSKLYGYNIETYIYANKGFVIIANTYADEVYEIQTFSPTSVEGYIKNYGGDINEYREIKE